MSVAQHLLDRHTDASRYSVIIDEPAGVATFLLFDLSGAVSGYQQYRPAAEKVRKNDQEHGRYFTYKSTGRQAVFGLESWRWSRPLYIVEGIFDCVRLHNIGYSAIATLSNDPKQLAEWLWTINRPIYAVCDSGDGGEKLAAFAHRHVTCNGGDLGSMTDDEVARTLAAF
jgi:hypothetical protein